jgi:hypothetical protein
MKQHTLTVTFNRYEHPRLNCEDCDYTGTLPFDSKPRGYHSRDAQLERAQVNHRLDVIMDRLVDYPDKKGTVGEIPTDELHVPLPLAVGVRVVDRIGNTGPEPPDL